MYIVETLTNLGMCAKNLCLEANGGVRTNPTMDNNLVYYIMLAALNRGQISKPGFSCRMAF